MTHHPSLKTHDSWAEAAVWRASFYNMICLGAVGLIFVIFARQIIHLFTDDPNVVPYGVDCLRIVAYGFLFYALVFGVLRLDAALSEAQEVR